MRWGPFWFEVFFFIFCILFKSLTQIYHNGWRSFFESSYFVSTFEYLGNISGELKVLVPGSKTAKWMASNSVLPSTCNNLCKKLAAICWIKPSVGSLRERSDWGRHALWVSRLAVVCVPGTPLIRESIRAEPGLVPAAQPSQTWLSKACCAANRGRETSSSSCCPKLCAERDIDIFTKRR